MPAVLPVLYSFRRCPYAIRARLALKYAGIRVALREVVLRDKPQEMLEVSPKGTVPVLVLPETGEVIDESLDIMFWAVAQNDPDSWLDTDLELAGRLIDANDDQFKPWLDRYKYPDRYDDAQSDDARAHCEVFLQALTQCLRGGNFVCGTRASIADMAIYSFVRQFAFVDMEWFGASYPELNRWLQAFLDGPLFASVMEKYPQWHAENSEPVF
jgi:glutathione S-transferase